MANTARIPSGKKRITITLDLKTLELLRNASEKNFRNISNEVANLINEKYGSKDEK